MINLILFCPMCCERHIDDGEFATKPHHTHACQKCGFVWRPAVENTRGVQFLDGFKNEETKEKKLPFEIEVGQNWITKLGYQVRIREKFPDGTFSGIVTANPGTNNGKTFITVYDEFGKTQTGNHNLYSFVSSII